MHNNGLGKNYIKSLSQSLKKTNPLWKASGNHEKIKYLSSNSFAASHYPMFAVILKVISTNQTIGGQNGKEIKI